MEYVFWTYGIWKNTKAEKRKIKIWVLFPRGKTRQATTGICSLEKSRGPIIPRDKRRWTLNRSLLWPMLVRLLNQLLYIFWVNDLLFMIKLNHMIIMETYSDFQRGANISYGRSAVFSGKYIIWAFKCFNSLLILIHHKHKAIHPHIQNIP